MFRTIQKLEPSVKMEPRLKSLEIGEDGVAQYIDVPAVGEFPPAENFELQNLLKAGVPLKEVNTKILGNRSTVDAEAFVEQLTAKIEPETKIETESKED